MNHDALALILTMAAFVVACWGLVNDAYRTGERSLLLTWTRVAILALTALYIALKLTCPALWFESGPGDLRCGPVFSTPATR